MARRHYQRRPPEGVRVVCPTCGYVDYLLLDGATIWHSCAGRHHEWDGNRKTRLLRPERKEQQ